MISYTFTKDKEGKITSNVNFAAKVLELQEGKYQVTIKKFHKDRTINQNSWYWKILTIIGNDLGYTSKELNEVFKFNFLSDDNKGLYTCRSTRELNTKEMGEYFEKIFEWSARQGIVIEDPKDYI